MKPPARCLVLLVLPCSLYAQSPEEYHARADAALESFLLKFWSQGASYLKAHYPDNGSATGYWTFAQGFDAVLDGVERTEGKAYAGWIETLFDAQNQRGWIVDYYDDENWMALALLRAHDLTGDTHYLQRAAALFADIRNGWDTTCCGSKKGGIWWNKAHTQKATASNAGVVILAARLYEHTQLPTDLDFAKQVYAYWFENMVDPSSYQVTDHINPDGTKVFWKFTYNEGLMIGASIELYRATADEQYLTNAQRITSFVAFHETVSTAYGKVLDDGTSSSCAGDCQAFKGPAFRYLKLLYDVTESPAYLNLLRSSANAIWSIARNSAEEIFAVSWAGPAPVDSSEPQAAAAVMALNLFAEASGPFPGTGRPSNQYEAEEAAISGVGIEASHAGFTGWGYVAGWNGPGQKVDFSIHVPASGTYELIFHYAGGGGSASRRIRIGGATAVANFSFPGTGSWDSYSTVAFERALASGESVVSVAFDSASGSHNYLNLDHLVVRSLTPRMVRGDANADGVLDLTDAVAIALYLFGGRPNLVECQAAADADSSGGLDIADALFILRYIFQLGAEPGSPFPECGADPLEVAASCGAYPPCE